MVKQYVEPNNTGKIVPRSVSTGRRHVFVARRIELDRRYHDDEPIQEAAFTVTFDNGLEMKGKLDKMGRATLLGVPSAGSVRFGPDARAYELVDDRKNPDYRAALHRR